jgi:hypothetical protein
MQTTDTPQREELRPRSATCECAACEERFRSVSGFDAHRTGPPDARRSLTPAQMRQRGMSLNAKGLWITKVREP